MADLMPELFNYQKQDIATIVRRKRCIIAHKMGLGKTVIALKAIEAQNAFPCLVIGTKNSLAVWETEIQKWLDMPCAIYSGKPHERQKALRTYIDYQLPFLITNYAFIEEVAKYRSKWPAIILDEIHLAGLLNHKTQTFKKVKRLFDSEILYPVTGSIIRKNPADIFAPLHLLHPSKFPSYWKFVSEHCITIKDTFGTTIEPRPKNPAKFRDMAFRYMIRRTKDEPEVKAVLPDKFRYSYPVYMTPKQYKMYLEMAEEKLIIDGDNIIVAPNAMVRDGDLRQLLVSPRLLGLNEDGGILEALPEIAQSEYAEGNPLVIFTPYRRATVLIAEKLSKVSSHVGIIKGDMSYRQIHNVAKAFQEYKNPDKAVICTIQSSTSFTLHSSSVCYFAGYEWDFNHNEQAEDRLHRTGQKNNVRILYMKHLNTIDEHVIETFVAKKFGADIALTPEHLLPERYRVTRLGV